MQTSVTTARCHLATILGPWFATGNTKTKRGPWYYK